MPRGGTVNTWVDRCWSWNWHLVIYECNEGEPNISWRQMQRMGLDGCIWLAVATTKGIRRRSDAKMAFTEYKACIRPYLCQLHTDTQLQHDSSVRLNSRSSVNAAQPTCNIFSTLIFRLANFGLVWINVMSISVSCSWAAFVWDSTLMLTVRCGRMCERINSTEQQKTVNWTEHNSNAWNGFLTAVHLGCIVKHPGWTPYLYILVCTKTQSNLLPLWHLHITLPLKHLWVFKLQNNWVRSGKLPSKKWPYYFSALHPPVTLNKQNLSLSNSLCLCGFPPPLLPLVATPRLLFTEALLNLHLVRCLQWLQCSQFLLLFSLPPTLSFVKMHSFKMFLVVFVLLEGS